MRQGIIFSYLSGIGKAKNIPCWLTYTNRDTHEIINRNLERSPLFSGVIECGSRMPSIESRLCVLPEKKSTRYFLNGRTAYTEIMSGNVNSLPEDVQLNTQD